MDAGQTWAAEGRGRRLIFCETQNRTDPISGFAKNGDASAIQAYIHAKVSRVRCGTCTKTTPRSWLNLPMCSRLMAPVPRTSARSVWICRQATRLACVSIGPGRRSPSMSFTSFSSSTRQLTKCVAKKSKGPWSCDVHATSGSRSKPAWSNRQKAPFAKLRRRNLKTHRSFRIQETLRESFHSAQSAAQTELFLGRGYSWARCCRLEPIKAVAKMLKKHWPSLPMRSIPGSPTAMSRRSIRSSRSPKPGPAATGPPGTCYHRLPCGG